MIPESEPDTALQPPVAAVEQLGPVGHGERIDSIDVLRGASLLGILLMNIYGFGLPWPAYSNPLMGGGSDAWSLGTWWATHLFAEMKFMTIFSMLFGAGLALMAQRADARGTPFGRLYYRRILWLLLFGLLHAYLLWFGDILYWYAVCGLVLYPLRRLRPAALISLGLVVLLVTVPLGLMFGFFALPEMQAEYEAALAAEEAGETLTDEQQEAIEGWRNMNPDAETMEEDVAAYRGGYLGQVVHRAPLVLMFQTVFMVVFGFWRITGLMLIGMALMKLGVFAAQRSGLFYGACCLVGYGIGLPIVFLGARGLFAHGFDPMFVNQGGMLPNYFASILVAMGHVGAIMLVCKAGLLGWITRPLAAVGRMALTNYLGQTLLCTAVFYGWGLGLFDRLVRVELMAVVFAVWVLQLIGSPWWLSRFRFGPAEWLWRSLTYGKRQLMAVSAIPSE